MSAGMVETPTRTFQASAALDKYLRVKLSSGKLAAAGIGEGGLGTLDRAALASDDYVPVRLWTAQGTRKMVAAGAVTQFANVYAAASGKVDDTNSGHYLGIALQAATADDDIIEVLPLTGGSLTRVGNTAGVGITGTAASFVTSVETVGTMVKTSILIDLTGLNSGGTANDIIGADGAGAAHLGQITAAVNGTIVAGTMTCLETPATGDDDINVYSATEATGVEDTAIGDLTETALCNSGDLTAGTVIGLAAPAADQYLYLTGGTGDSDATYTAGILLLEFWGK